MSVVNATLATPSRVAPANDAAASMLGRRASRGELARWFRSWWPLCLGFVALVFSSAWRFAFGLWQLPEFDHCPLVLACALWILWDKRTQVVRAERPESARPGVVLMVAGLLVYLLGVRLKAGYIETWALVPVLAGGLALVGGWTLVRRCAMVFLFLLLAAPMPAPLIFAATSGLKEWVSWVAETLLHAAGYPIARDGVTLRIGQYNLLLADACSGLNSLISLSALGILYVYLTARRAAWHTALLIASILPVAVATNIVRVLILTLITYHFGDQAGQGFLHEFAGFAMFFVALVILALFDLLLGRISARLATRSAA